MSKKGGQEIEKWDWEQNDREFYQKFLKLPESKNREAYKAMKEHRYKYGSTRHKIDLRPRVFFQTMKIEIIMLIFGVGFAITLPFYSKYLHAKVREPDDINIKNIKNRVKSDPIAHEETKRKLKLEDKLKTHYIKDESHEKIRNEIEKTMKELYGDDEPSYSPYDNNASKKI